MRTSFRRPLEDEVKSKLDGAATLAKLILTSILLLTGAGPSGAQSALAEARSKLERANRRPDLDVLAGYKRTNGLNTAIAGLQLNLPIFDRNQGARASAEKDILAPQESLLAIRAILNTELAIAQKQFEIRRDQVLSRYRPLRHRAMEISSISRAAYLEGGTDLLRLLDPERLRTDAQVAYVLALLEYHLTGV